MSSDRKLGEYLVAANLIDEAQMKQALAHQQRTREPLSQILPKLGFIDDHKMTDLLAQQENLQVVDIASMVLPIELVKSVPKGVIEKYRVIPIHKTQDVITLAVADLNTMYEAIEQVQFVTGKRVEVHLAPHDDLEAAIKTYFGALKGQFDDPVLKELSEPELKPFKDPTAAAKKKRPAPQVRPEKLYEKYLPALIPLLIDKGIVTRAELEAKFNELRKPS